MYDAFRSTDERPHKTDANYSAWVKVLEPLEPLDGGASFLRSHNHRWRRTRGRHNQPFSHRVLRKCTMPFVLSSRSDRPAVASTLSASLPVNEVTICLGAVACAAGLDGKEHCRLSRLFEHRKDGCKWRQHRPPCFLRNLNCIIRDGARLERSGLLVWYV